eukprot:TRINITY_DN6691_c0_g3_i2.p1 TRINITY_DN6691_c0_g3~~TRINITY_DN6691_c0_g3_i2.p1  ORF type:complete len:228 (-),score=36.61 TRINITY_DN6691_c0_g3_i2:87-770(-)
MSVEVAPGTPDVSPGSQQKAEEVEIQYKLVPKPKTPGSSRRKVQWKKFEDLSLNSRGQNNEKGNGNEQDGDNSQDNRRGRGGRRGRRRNYPAQGSDWPGYYSAPFIPPLPASLSTDMIRQQLLYYFSTDNLVKDVFLRTQMKNGYVPASLLASFNRMRAITQSVTAILEVARTLPSLKVKNGCIRMRQNWHLWTFPPMQAPEVESDEEDVKEEKKSSDSEVQPVASE